MNPTDFLTQSLTDRQFLQSVAFPNPWAARAFGLTLAAAEQRLFTLTEFQQCLIGSIGELEAQGQAITGEEQYYSCWIEALSRLLKQKRLLTPDRLQSEELRIRDYTRQLHQHQPPHYPPRPLVIQEGR
ncbi:nitrile hydratase accessory protein [Sodalis sp. RH22]|uniref:nitrile hydratase accessory protein n=1 Tax=unclassified Sodalis (in: enterobacteria) TaxID=2636512 RepID=UPI0039B53A40